MSRAPVPTAMLDLPPGPGLSALRAGLMAMRVLPVGLPTDRHGRGAVLGKLDAHPGTVVFIDISHSATSSAPTLLELDAAVPRDSTRARIFLTRLAGGHVSAGDRRWVRALGFADLLPEFDALDCEGHLRDALDAVASALSLACPTPAELTRYARVMNAERNASSPRAVIRSLTGLSAEAFADLLDRSLAIEDRSFRLQTYPRCFVGSEAVAWMVRKLHRSDAEAVALGQALGTLGLLVHVTHDHPFLDDHLFYRLACSNGIDRLDLGSLFDDLSGPAGVPVADRTHLTKTYARCWVGLQAVDWLVRQHTLSRIDGWLVLHRLMQFGLIDHVAYARPFIDGAFFYRFATVPQVRHV